MGPLRRRRQQLGNGNAVKDLFGLAVGRKRQFLRWNASRGCRQRSTKGDQPATRDLLARTGSQVPLAWCWRRNGVYRRATSSASHAAFFASE